MILVSSHSHNTVYEFASAFHSIGILILISELLLSFIGSRSNGFHVNCVGSGSF